MKSGQNEPLEGDVSCVDVPPLAPPGDTEPKPRVKKTRVREGTGRLSERSGVLDPCFRVGASCVPPCYVLPVCVLVLVLVCSLVARVLPLFSKAVSLASTMSLVQWWIEGLQHESQVGPNA